MTAINIEMIEKNTELLLHETRRLTTYQRLKRRCDLGIILRLCNNI
jgi:hypothetical protein